MHTASQAIKKNSIGEKARRAAFEFLYHDFSIAYNLFVKVLGWAGPQVVVEAILPYLPQEKCLVLDAGCGTGLTGKSLKSHRDDIELDGFDFAPDMVAQAKKSGLYNNLFIADATKTLPCEKQTYDAVISSGLYTLGHVGPEALEPVINAIKTGGIFALNIFEPAWIKMGFGPALDRLVEEDKIEIIHEGKAAHWRAIKSHQCHILVLKIK
jgi:predicted TPR repeat methyltransferase